jgi:hypothetical protein
MTHVLQQHLLHSLERGRRAGIYSVCSVDAPTRQFRFDIGFALCSRAFAGLHDGECDEPRGERLLPGDARQLRADGEGGLLPNRGSDGRASAACNHTFSIQVHWAVIA